MMIVRTFLTTALWAAFFTPAMLYAGDTMQNGQEAMLKLQVSADLTNVHSAEALEYLARTYHIPCGVQISSGNGGETNDKGISIHLSRVPLRTALDSIVSANPRFRWEAVDGVIDLLPVDESGSLLDIKIAHVHIPNSTVKQAERDILDLPEIQAGLKKRHLRPGNFDLWKMNKEVETTRVNIEMQHTTLRHLLNKIAEQTDFWSSSTFGEYFWLSLGEGAMVAPNELKEHPPGE